MEFLSKLHPVTVHFPIAIMIVYSLFEIFALFKNDLTFYKTTLVLLIIGITGAVLSVLTGNQAMHLLNESAVTISPELSTAVSAHEDSANLFLWYFIFFTVLRVYLHISKKILLKIRYILAILLIFGIYFTYETGRLGGILVYKFGVGTDLILHK